MTLWIVFALMTAVAIMAVLWPLARGRQALRAGTDVAVYRDQLEEIERDKAAGTIGAAEAEAAKVEVSRRLIAAVDAAPGGAATEEQSASRPLWRRRLAAAVALIALPLGAAVLYLALGSPQLPGQPLAERIARAHGGNQSIVQLIAKVEAHLRQNPNDGRGWEVIAPVYMRLGRFAAAVSARRNALRLLGATAEREAYLGEALMSAANGVITADAKAAFDRAIKLDANNVAARYYQGLAAEQDGRRADAIKIWRAMLASAPPGAPWIAEVQQVLTRVGAGDTAKAPPSAQLPSLKQTEMIRGMVSRLAERLKKDGSDAESWQRLVRSYLVLGERDKARAAVEDARRALKGDAAKMAPIEALLKTPPKPMAASTATPSTPAAPAAPAAPKPSKMAAVTPKPPHQNTDQASEMVRRLADKLKKDGNNPQGWEMLVRSYLVMGDRAKAQAAVEDARKALSNDAAKMARLETLMTKGLDATPAPDLPGTAKAGAPHQSGDQIKGMVERLAEKLKKDGNNPQGWEMLVRSYAVMGERDKAKAAIEDARRALGNDATKMAAIEAAAKAPVARAAPPPSSVPATPPATAAPANPPAATSGPSKQDMAAAAKLAPAQRSEMIRGMVTRLAERLKTDGSDVDGWLRLVRSYVVLGERDKAQAAAADARRALAGDPDKLRRLEELVKGLGLAG